MDGSIDGGRAHGPGPDSGDQVAAVFPDSPLSDVPDDDPPDRAPPAKKRRRTGTSAGSGAAAATADDDDDDDQRNRPPRRRTTQQTAPGKLDETQRKAVLRADPLARSVEANRVFCADCKKWVKLGEGVRFRVKHWAGHCALVHKRDATEAARIEASGLATLSGSTTSPTPRSPTKITTPAAMPTQSPSPVITPSPVMTTMPSTSVPSPVLARASTKLDHRTDIIPPQPRAQVRSPVKHELLPTPPLRTPTHVQVPTLAYPFPQQQGFPQFAPQMTMYAQPQQHPLQPRPAMFLAQQYPRAQHQQPIAQPYGVSPMSVSPQSAVSDGINPLALISPGPSSTAVDSNAAAFMLDAFGADDDEDAIGSPDEDAIGSPDPTV